MYEARTVYFRLHARLTLVGWGRKYTEYLKKSIADGMSEAASQEFASQKIDSWGRAGGWAAGYKPRKPISSLNHDDFLIQNIDGYINTWLIRLGFLKLFKLATKIGRRLKVRMSLLASNSLATKSMLLYTYSSCTRRYGLRKLVWNSSEWSVLFSVWRIEWIWNEEVPRRRS